MSEHSFNKDLYEACMKQADYFAGRWDRRRDDEWRMSVSLWTLLGAGCALLLGKGHVPAWTIVVPIVLHLMWLYHVWRANDFDKVMGREFRDAAQKLLIGTAFAPPGFPRRQEWYRLFRDRSMRFQLGCTIMLSVTLLFLNRLPLSQPSFVVP